MKGLLYLYIIHPYNHGQITIKFSHAYNIIGSTDQVVSLDHYRIMITHLGNFEIPMPVSRIFDQRVHQHGL